MEDFKIDLGLMIWTWLTFGMLLLLLARFAFRPLRKAMDAREQRIRESLERARQSHEEAERALAENEKRLSEARDETRRIIDEGKRIAADIKREGEARAQRDADAIVSQARHEIENETRRSLDELKGTVANLSVRIARQVIRENLDESRHEQLAEHFIERLKKSHGSQA